MDFNEQVFCKTQETPWNNIDQEAVVLNLDNGHYYVLNETGRRVWELLDGQKTVGEIVNLICEEYEVTQEDALSDISKLLKELVEEGLATTNP